jgi:hypothetical protein
MSFLSGPGFSLFDSLLFDVGGILQVTRATPPPYSELRRSVSIYLPRTDSRKHVQSPIDDHALPNLSYQFCRDDFKVVFAHDFDRAVVLRERIVERDFFRVEPELFTALPGFCDLLSELDQFYW